LANKKSSEIKVSREREREREREGGERERREGKGETMPRICGIGGVAGPYTRKYPRC
jgi:hypothetical protein